MAKCTISLECKAIEDLFREEKDGTYSVRRDLVEILEQRGYVITPKDTYDGMVSDLIQKVMQTDEKTVPIDEGTKSDAEAFRKPKKPILLACDGFSAVVASSLCCPTCRNTLTSYYRKVSHPPYCMLCGQAIDWSDDNDEL